MIDINGLTIQFAGRVLIKDISFKIVEGDRIGLIGRNGAGKTTLMSFINNVCGKDDVVPAIRARKNLSVGFLEQEIWYNKDLTVSAELISHFIDIDKVNSAIAKLEYEISTIGTEEDLRGKKGVFDELEYNIKKLKEYQGNSFQKRMEITLLGLGFERGDFDRLISEFSGGWKMRIELAKLILAEHDLLLLDEPTNHLDIESIIWFEQYLKNFKGAVLLISHDKRFLDNITNRTIEIVNSSIVDYKVKYSDYLIKRKLEREILVSAAKDQEKDIKRTEELINKFRAKKNKAAFAQSLIKKLDKLDRVEVDEDQAPIPNINFPLAKGGFKVLLEMNNFTKAFGNKSLFKSADLIITRGERIALIGKNGIGKSTFLKIIMGDVDFEGSVRVPDGVKFGYFAQDEVDRLDVSKTVLETIDDCIVVGSNLSARSLLGAFMFSKDDVEKKVKVLSGGEKMRLALCKMIITPVHLLILDEPTNHLDMKAKEVLKEALRNFGGTVLVVSHDREFLEGLTTSVYEIYDKRIRVHSGSIDEFLKKYSYEMDDLKVVSVEEGDSVKVRTTKEGGAYYFNKKEQGKVIRSLEKLINKNEREIGNLESEIKEKEELITEGTSMDGFDWDFHTTQLSELNIKLEEVTLEWENNCNKLDEIKKER